MKRYLYAGFGAFWAGAAISDKHGAWFLLDLALLALNIAWAVES